MPGTRVSTARGLAGSMGLPAGETVVSAVDGVHVRVNGREAMSFASCNYLAFSYGVEAAEGLTLSMPRASGVHEAQVALERDFSQLTGHESAIAAASSLHLLCACAQELTRGGTLCISRHAYPLLRMAAACASQRDASVEWLEELTVSAVSQAFARARPPLLLMTEALDGSGTAAPLRELLAVCRRRRALLVVDDTQGFGLLGTKPEPAAPYGYGGAGSLARLGCRDRCLVLVASFAKAFGVPLACAGGSESCIDSLRAASTFVYSSSGPDLPSVSCARQALAQNRERGDAARRALAETVRSFRHAARTTGAGLFPAQRWSFASLQAARQVHQRLLARGIWALLDSTSSRRPAILFLLTAQHTGPTLHRALAAIEGVRSAPGT